MSVIILYETRHGYILECANMLSKKLDNALVKHINDDVDFSNYESILIGAPIYKGELEKTVTSFLNKYKLKLLDKKVGFFCAGMNTMDFNQAVQESVPTELFMHAEIVHCGGIIDFSKLSLIEKLTVRRRLGIKSKEILDYKHKLDDLVDWMNK